MKLSEHIEANLIIVLEEDIVIVRIYIHLQFIQERVQVSAQGCGKYTKMFKATL